MKIKTVYNLFPVLSKSRIWGGVSFPLSFIYSIIIFLKNFFYDKKIIKPIRISAKIISVGNITVGGSGKTPLVKTIASLLVKEGRRVAVVSRGYGGRKKGTLCVSDGTNILTSAQQCGDEPLLLANNLPGIPVIVGRDRIKSARYAETHFRSEIIILDDGFQHRKIKRDIDIITVNAANPWGNRMVLPGGPLREPLKNLQRGDIFVLTQSDKIHTCDPIKSDIRKYSRNPLFLTCHHPAGFYRRDGKKISLSSLNNSPILAFSGIANPGLFRSTLLDIGCEVKDSIPFPDHHYFTETEKKNIIKQAQDTKVKAIITTEKDIMRIATWNNDAVPLYYLKIELTFVPAIDTFKHYLDTLLDQS